MSSKNLDLKRRAEFDRIVAKFSRDASVLLKLPPVRPYSASPGNLHCSTPDALLDTWQAAKELGVAKHTLDNWRTSGDPPLPFVRIGSNVRYRKADLDAFMKANTFCSTSQYGGR